MASKTRTSLCWLPKVITKHIAIKVYHKQHFPPLYYLSPSKTRKLSFTSNNHMSLNPFDLIHVDVCGPLSIATHASYSYFLNIVEDATRYICVFMLKQKSDVTLIISQFFKLIETQYGKVIKQMLFDNAPKLKFTEFFKEKRVLNQFSCINCLPQNSMVERKHQHILYTIWALFFELRVPLTFWGEYILTVVYLINIIPLKLLQWKSPFQLLNNSPLTTRT